MKSYIFPFLLLTSILIGSCGTSESTKSTEENLFGTWTLFKETKQGKSIDYAGVPSASRIEFDSTGYFVYYDQITDEKISNAGVGVIQDHYKGQFKLEEMDLKMNHYIQDTLIVKKFKIEKISDTELVLIDEKAGKTSYFKK